jgi:ribosomal protein L23
VHGLHVEKVSTINYQGKKKKEVDFQGKPHYYRCANTLLSAQGLHGYMHAH